MSENPNSRHPGHPDAAFFGPDITVATVILHAGRLLVVEEIVRGQRVLNQPAGHLEPGESLHAAAIRETLEETGWDVRLCHFIGAYQWTADPPQRSFLRFAFAAEPIRHHPDRPLDDGIEAALWLTPGELAARAGQHRSPMVWRVVADYLAGQRLPLDSVAAIA
ncbi:MAG TPA: NUDIX hydrolase [Xanthomonadales bacterium]|nr:NUDIX hydrolase [Xanthomonadales bacterium]